MTASLDDSYRLITIDAKTANDPMPAIRLAGGDIAGRVLKVTGWPSGYTPRIAYNPAPDGSASGGYIESARTGIDSANYGYAYFKLPRGIFKSTHAVLAFELLGEDAVISSRRIPVIVEPPVVNADGGEAYDGLSDLHNAAAIAKDAAGKATTAESTFNQAVRAGKTAINEAITDFNTKGNQAIEADTQRVTALIDSANITASSSAVNPNVGPSVAATPDAAGVAKDLAFKLPRAQRITGITATTLAPNSAPTVTTAATATGDVDVTLGIPRAARLTATAKAGTTAAADVTQTADENGDQTLAFTIPRGKSITTVTATASENGGDPTATLIPREDGDWNLALTLPRGPKGDKGNAGDVATPTVAGVVKPGTGLTVTSNGTLNANTATLTVAGIVKPGVGFSVASGTLNHGNDMLFYGADGYSASTEGGPIIVDSFSGSQVFSLSFWLLGRTGEIAKIGIYLPNFDYQKDSTVAVKNDGSAISGCTCEYGGSYLKIAIPTGLEYTQAVGGMSYWHISVMPPTTTAAEEILGAGRSKAEIASTFADVGYQVAWDDDDHATVTRQTDPALPAGPTADPSATNGPTADTDKAQPIGPAGSSSTVTAPDTAQSDGPTTGGLN